MTKIVYSLFDNPINVRNAIAALNVLGAEPRNITISARDPGTHELIRGADSEAGSPVAGAGAGAAAGSVAGAALSVIPAALAGPVLGPVFLLFGIGGAMVGAISGSVAGAILGSGYELQHIEAVENSLAEGKILLAVKAQPEQAADFEAALDHAGGMVPELHRQ
jgi:hypothetical protein